MLTYPSVNNILLDRATTVIVTIIKHAYFNEQVINPVLLIRELYSFLVYGMNSEVVHPVL